jgi:hypothetical protein
MPFPVNLFTSVRYHFIRHSSEIKTVIERAAIGLPPRVPSAPQQGLISMARHTTSPANVNRN